MGLINQFNFIEFLKNRESKISFSLKRCHPDLSSKEEREKLGGVFLQINHYLLTKRHNLDFQKKLTNKSNHQQNQYLYQPKELSLLSEEELFILCKIIEENKTKHTLSISYLCEKLFNPQFNKSDFYQIENFLIELYLKIKKLDYSKYFNLVDLFCLKKPEKVEIEINHSYIDKCLLLKLKKDNKNITLNDNSLKIYLEKRMIKKSKENYLNGDYSKERYLQENCLIIEKFFPEAIMYGITGIGEKIMEIIINNFVDQKEWQYFLERRQNFYNLFPEDFDYLYENDNEKIENHISLIKVGTPISPYWHRFGIFCRDNKLTESAPKYFDRFKYDQFLTGFGDDPHTISLQEAKLFLHIRKNEKLQFLESPKQLYLFDERNLFDDKDVELFDIEVEREIDDIILYEDIEWEQNLNFLLLFYAIHTNFIDWKVYMLYLNFINAKILENKENREIIMNELKPKYFRIR